MRTRPPRRSREGGTGRTPTSAAALSCPLVSSTSPPLECSVRRPARAQGKWRRGLLPPAAGSLHWRRWLGLRGWLDLAAPMSGPGRQIWYAGGQIRCPRGWIRVDCDAKGCSPSSGVGGEGGRAAGLASRVEAVQGLRGTACRGGGRPAPSLRHHLVASCDMASAATAW